MHDDQHGTACVVTAALLNAEKVASGRPLAESRIGVVGLGAAGLAISKMLMFLTGHSVAEPTSHPPHSTAWPGPADARSGRDHGFLGCRDRRDRGGRPDQAGHGPARPDHPGSFNPAPEIEPAAAREAGAAFAADGKSVNNVLGSRDLPRCGRRQRPPHHPGHADRGGRRPAATARPGEIVPSPLDRTLHPRVARAVARVALEKGLNRDDLTGYFED